MDQSSAGHINYKFTALGTSYAAKVSDGTNVYTIHPYGSGGSTMECTCTKSHKLLCNGLTHRTASDTTGVARFPESLSVVDQVNLASSFSVRSFTKLGSYLRINNKPLQWSTGSTTY